MRNRTPLCVQRSPAGSGSGQASTSKGPSLGCGSDGEQISGRSQSVRFQPQSEADPAVGGPGSLTPSSPREAPRASMGSEASARSNSGLSPRSLGSFLAPLKRAVPGRRPQGDKAVSLLSSSSNRKRAPLPPGRSSLNLFRSASSLTLKQSQHRTLLPRPTVGRCAPEDEWPPGTEWPQAAPPGSHLPGDAAFLDRGYRVLMQEAALRPGLMLVYPGSQVRVPGADRGICTFSVWNGALPEPWGASVSLTSATSATLHISSVCLCLFAVPLFM